MPEKKEVNRRSLIKGLITIDVDKLMAPVDEPRRYRPRFDQDDGSVVDW